METDFEYLGGSVRRRTESGFGPLWHLLVLLHCNLGLLACALLAACPRRTLPQSFIFSIGHQRGSDAAADVDATDVPRYQAGGGRSFTAAAGWRTAVRAAIHRLKDSTATGSKIR